MKSLVEYINEASDMFKRFKISNIRAELEENKVSKSRISEIAKFYEKALGPAPYYCVSPYNEERKSIQIMNNIEKINYWEIADDDSEEWKNAKANANEKYKKHNDFVDSLTDELKNKFNELKKLRDMKLPKGAFKFGRRGYDTYILHVIIVYIDGDFVPCVMQDVYNTNKASVFNSDNRVFWFAEKDIK